jgi:hypothetical protein
LEKKLKIETGFKLKILETKLPLNLSQFYWRLKLVWKNLKNSPKLLFALPFQIVNLE